MRTLFVTGLLLVSSCAKPKDKAVHAAGYCSLIPYNINDATKGMLDLDEVGADAVVVRGAIKGMNPGSYSVHLHRPAGCPRPAQQGDDAANHAADVGVITADAGGIAAFNLTIPSSRLVGNTTIKEHCLVVYKSDLSGYVGSCRIYTR